MDRDNGQQVPLPGCMIGPSEPCDAFKRQTDRIDELENALAAERGRLDATKREVDAALDCYKAALNAMRKDWREMFESTQAAGVELAAERERREAADKILHDIRNRGIGGWVTSAIDAYFARYKKD